MLFLDTIYVVCSSDDGGTDGGHEEGDDEDMLQDEDAVQDDNAGQDEDAVQDDNAGQDEDAVRKTRKAQGMAQFKEAFTAIFHDETIVSELSDPKSREEMASWCRQELGRRFSSSGR